MSRMRPRVIRQTRMLPMLSKLLMALTMRSNNNNDATAQSETSADGESAPSAVNTVVPQSTDSNTVSVQPRSTSKDAV